MSSTYINMFFVLEAGNMPSEKVLTGGSVAIATLTSGKAFAAGIGQFITERTC